MDSLYRRWLFDRRSIQRQEVASVFFPHLGIAHTVARMARVASELPTTSELIGSVNILALSAEIEG